MYLHSTAFSAVYKFRMLCFHFHLFQDIFDVPFDFVFDPFVAQECMV